MASSEKENDFSAVSSIADEMKKLFGIKSTDFACKQEFKGFLDSKNKTAEKLFELVKALTKKKPVEVAKGIEGVYEALKNENAALKKLNECAEKEKANNEDRKAEAESFGDQLAKELKNLNA